MAQKKSSPRYVFSSVWPWYTWVIQNTDLVSPWLLTLLFSCLIYNVFQLFSCAKLSLVRHISILNPCVNNRHYVNNCEANNQSICLMGGVIPSLKWKPQLGDWHASYGGAASGSLCPTDTKKVEANISTLNVDSIAFVKEITMIFTMTHCEFLDLSSKRRMESYMLK